MAERWNSFLPNNYYTRLLLPSEPTLPLATIDSQCSPFVGDFVLLFVFKIITSVFILYSLFFLFWIAVSYMSICFVSVVYNLYNAFLNCLRYPSISLSLRSCSSLHRSCCPHLAGLHCSRPWLDYYHEMSRVHFPDEV